MRLTEREWWALCAAVAEREEALSDRREQGEAVGHELAALDRAAQKIRPLAPPIGGRRVHRRRAS